MEKSFKAFLTLITIVSSVLSGCKKDQLNSKELLAFTKVNNGISPTTFSTQVTISGKAINLSDSMIVIKSFLTRPTETNVEISFGVDNSATASYNKLYNTTYKLLPSNGFRLINGSTNTIKAGSDISSDSLTVQITNKAVFKSDSGYILPISIKSISSNDKGVKISSNYRTIYILFNVAFNNINQSDNMLNGVNINRNQPKWQIIYATPPYMDTTDASNLLDGDNNTCWFLNYFNNSANQVIIDMSTNYVLKGISLTPNYLYGPEYNPKNVEVETSNDGSTFVRQGYYNFSPVNPDSSPNNPDVKNVNFYTPVNCRFFRLTLDQGNYVGLAEVNAFK